MLGWAFRKRIRPVPPAQNTQETVMSGHPSFVELGVPSGSAARGFYEQALGWRFQDMGNDNFWAQTETAQIGLHPQDPDACFVVYFAVDDLDAALERVLKLGGREVRRADDPKFGRFVECRDPQGVRFGLHQRP
jgi:uncharacterized protein